MHENVFRVLRESREGDLLRTVQDDAMAIQASFHAGAPRARFAGRMLKL